MFIRLFLSIPTSHLYSFFHFGFLSLFLMVFVYFRSICLVSFSELFPDAVALNSKPFPTWSCNVQFRAQFTLSIPNHTNRTECVSQRRSKSSLYSFQINTISRFNKQVLKQVLELKLLGHGISSESSQQVVGGESRHGVPCSVGGTGDVR